MMVIITHGAGNHCNRLFQAVHLEAFCRENGIKYANPSFNDMAPYYGLRKEPFLAALSFILNILGKARFFPLANFNDFNRQEEYSAMIRRSRLTFAHGWCFRAPDLTKKYQEYFAKKYSLRPEYYAGNELIDFIKANKVDFQFVGIHIRRGDYINWADGKFYFSDEYYLKMIDRMKSIMTGGRETPFFIVFSNDSTSIPESEHLKVSKNPWYIDNFAMSLCDYLIGPPSTFSLWASYSGRAKYYHLKEKGNDFALEDFQVCNG